MLFLQRH